MLAALVLLAILTMGAVSASDSDDDGMTVSEDLNVESLVDVDVVGERENTDIESPTGELKSSARGLFAEELNALIESAPENGTVELNKDYEIEYDTITISKAVTIDGKNHIISGSPMDTMFTITDNNVVLKILYLKRDIQINL